MVLSYRELEIILPVPANGERESRSASRIRPFEAGESDAQSGAAPDQLTVSGQEGTVRVAGAFLDMDEGAFLDMDEGASKQAGPGTAGAFHRSSCHSGDPCTSRKVPLGIELRAQPAARPVLERVAAGTIAGWLCSAICCCFRMCLTPSRTCMHTQHLFTCTWLAASCVLSSNPAWLNGSRIQICVHPIPSYVSH
eukprot:2992761-Pleurochrysis_carterae.AAC.2